MARQLSPTVRVVARLANGVLREAMAVGNGPGAILDVADLAAPSVVEACLATTTHTITAGGVQFVVSGADAPRSGSLRESMATWHRWLSYLGNVRNCRAPSVACPGRDLTVDEGDWVAMIGTAEELATQGIAVEATATATVGAHRSPLSRLANAVRAFRHDVNPNFYRALGVSLSLMACSTFLLWFTYNRPGMSFVDALYFSAETIATVGYGDFSFIDQPTWLRLSASR